ncbi:MAG: DNA-packaging protein [Vulcanibacillus sp.]
MPTNEVLTLIKIRLQVSDDSLDVLITSYINEIGQRILNYCNLLEVPLELEPIWASMTIDALRIEQPSISEVANTNGGAVELQIGDTSVKPSGNSGITNNSKSVIDNLVLNYRIDLNRYRKMRW